jgi:hypothetical protein
MNLFPTPHLEKCTLENALLFGMAKSHLNQAFVQTQWGNRVVHLVIGLVEALPINLSFGFKYS